MQNPKPPLTIYIPLIIKGEKHKHQITVFNASLKNFLSCLFSINICYQDCVLTQKAMLVLPWWFPPFYHLIITEVNYVNCILMLSWYNNEIIRNR